MDEMEKISLYKNTISRVPELVFTLALFRPRLPMCFLKTKSFFQNV